MNQMPMGNQPGPNGQPFPGANPGPQGMPNMNPMPNGRPGGMPPVKNAGKGKPKKAKKSSNTGWVFLGIFLLIALIALGAYLGYQSAVRARVNEYNRQTRVNAAEQYMLAMEDIKAEKLENAKTRLEYVLQVDPSYPGARDQYQSVVIALFPKATPTPVMTSTPMPTATPDTRGEEEMFQSVQALMNGQNWSAALDQMDALRDKNLSYKSFDVDSMYYMALRNFGINLINAGYLESGIYKITMSEALGPIDANADAMRNAARSYLAGAGFWEIDWNKALEYYSNAAISYPNMKDQATGMTAQERYIRASFEVGNLYVISQDYCGAVPYYQQALAIADNVTYAPTATAVYEICYPPQPTAVPVEANESSPAQAEEVAPGEFVYDSSSDSQAFTEDGIVFE